MSFSEKDMGKTLDKHVAAYQGDNIYDFDNEILLTWYPQRILHHSGSSRSILELDWGTGTLRIFSPLF